MGKIKKKIKPGVPRKPGNPKNDDLGLTGRKSKKLFGWLRRK